MGLFELESAGALRILYILYINKDKKMGITELRKKVEASTETVDAKVKFLCIRGLVNDERIATFPQQRLVNLTAKGLLIAEHLAAVNCVLQGK